MIAFEEYVKENKEEFINKVIKISRELGIDPLSLTSLWST